MTFHGVPDIKHPWVNTDPANSKPTCAISKTKAAQWSRCGSWPSLWMWKS